MDRRKFMAGCLGGSLGLPLLAQAEAGLSKIIFPFAAGAGGDGLIGIKAVKGASPDGSMVLVTTGPTMYLLPMVETTPSFDTAKDFMPVSLLARFEFALVIGPAVDAAEFKSFVAWLKAHPDNTSFGVPSNGTIPHFMGSKLEKDLGIPLTRVPYRGSAPMLNDLIGGHISFGITTLADALPQHRAKGVKIIAASSAERSPFASDVPTLKESGIDLVADAWYGMWLPAGSPPELASKLGAAASAALAKPEVKAKLTAIGLIPVGSNADGLTKELAANTAFWQPIVKATGYKIEN